MPGVNMMPDPHERPGLEPFATIFLEIVVPAARLGGWFEAIENIPEEELNRISRRIEQELTKALGRALTPAIYVHALLVCGCLFCKAAESADLSVDDDPFPSAEAGFSLVKSLVLHHGLYDLYLMASA